jgi:hypothetical protein
MQSTISELSEVAEFNTEIANPEQLLEIEALLLENNKRIEKAITKLKRSHPSYFINYFPTKEMKSLGNSEILEFHCQEDRHSFIKDSNFFSVKATWDIRGDEESH